MKPIASPRSQPADPGPALVSGFYHPPQSSAAIPIVISFLSPAVWQIRPDPNKPAPASSPSVQWPLIVFQDQLDISSRLAGVERRIVFPNGSQVTTREDDKLDRLLTYVPGGRQSSVLSRLEGAPKRIIALGVVCLIAMVVMLRVALPTAADGLAVAMPQALVDQMGSGSLTALDQALFSPSTLPTARQRELETLFGQVVYAMGEDQRDFTLLFRDGGVVGANALALADGTIIFTDQIIALIDELPAPANQDQTQIANEAIAGIMAHEITHVTERHLPKSVLRSAGLAVVIYLVAGGMDGGEDILAIGTGVLELSYSREFEREADLGAWNALAQLGMSPEGVALFFEAIADPDQDSEFLTWLSTHPDTNDRIEFFRSGPQS
ncbi:MAG: M48 family metallopeptidase [Rhodospirillaceae bacterium]